MIQGANTAEKSMNNGTFGIRREPRGRFNTVNARKTQQIEGERRFNEDALDYQDDGILSETPIFGDIKQDKDRNDNII